MKQSGIDWIGEIPDDWKTRQIRYLFSLRDERNYKPLSEVNLISVYTDKGVLQHSDIEQTTGNKAQNADGYKHVYKNDLVVNIILCWMGALGISDFDGVTSPAYDVYAPKDLNTILPKYYHYLFRTPQFNGKCYTEGRGIMQMRWRTYSSEFKSIKVPLPPKATQQRIAEYLDSKCAQIDSIIDESKKSIEEYKAWKQSVIFEAVTGKNLNCKKKDSGIEWIGEIPEKYIKTRLKYLLDIKGRIGFRGYTNADMVSEGEGAITLSPSNLKNLKMDFSKKAFVSWEKYNESPEIQIKIDDILFVKTGSSYGKSSLVDYLPAESTINPQLVVFKNIKCNQKYLIYYLQTNIIQNQVENIVIGGTIPTMSQEKMKNMFIFLPPLPEQESIAKMLDSKCAQIDSLIAEKESLIADLTEYKKSLIFEVVTGKRSV